MRKSELVYRELLRGFMERKKAVFTQLELAKVLKISLSTANNALRPLRRMGAVKVKRRSFEIVNWKKILYYWASMRNLEKDIVYETRAEIRGGVEEIEKEMPPHVVFAAYSAYRFRFNDAPADHSEVYVYCSKGSLKNLMKKFKQKKTRANFPNLFVLKKDFPDNIMPVGHMFIDLWNLKTWYAWDFVKALEDRIPDF